MRSKSGLKQLCALLLIFAAFVSACTQEATTPAPTATMDLCPSRALDLWAGHAKMIIDDSSLLYGVADSCSDPDCYSYVAGEFKDFADILNRDFPPPICAEILHGMIRQNLIDEGVAFLAEASGDSRSANLLRRRVLDRMDTVDRILPMLLDGKFDVNLAYELDQISATETALPKPSSHPETLSTPEPSGFVIGNIRYRIPSGEGWCVSDKTVENGQEVHHLASFCLFTMDPIATVDIIHLGSTHVSSRLAIQHHIEGFMKAGFSVLNLQFEPEEFSRPIGQVTYAKMELDHPDLDRPYSKFLACVSMESEYYLLDGDLLDEYSEPSITFLLDSMEEIILSMITQ